ncbi:MAG: molybdate ABC transporter permease subunit [Pseudomonadales bacterium]|nr:molybdate ABC transporter permease subunit [Pseudomonadales bacterium]MBO6597716.1 molybdate ABC transporter permease subunit [Pseudomonadales bacterium]MBO6657906.1 molybdate ABC transporter permease subunit [Pseudomonadales bacterium]MBO6704031.1 molybdate ABC transporter permease subunit [Pseudomonadales bacterium]MBO6823954.1 molybdate ABC transporter permease subunit [Pseudomonadales bacterium]
MTDPDLLSLWITIKLAGITTLCLILIGTPLAWWLSRSKSMLRNLVEPLVALPIVLPPTVVGFYLLIAFSPNSLPGELWQSATGSQLAFSFAGLVVGSIIYSLPFYVQPLHIAFSSLQQELMEAASTLGAGPWDRFFNLAVPLSRRGFVIAICLAFAHTVGEFGIVLMIGGNIPDETRVLSIALFDHVEALDYDRAHLLAGGLLVFSFILLLILYAVDRHWQQQRRV